ncbi:glycosyltransferase [Candidatus Woesearchaeota archaeon]|nr:glycosyltransferase [Candidatus Woesearchaeota archaeon]
MTFLSIVTAFLQQVTEIGEFFFTQYDELGRPFLNFLNAGFSHIFDVFLILLTVVSFGYLLTTIYVKFRKREPYKEAPFEGELPFVTIQIPTRNELAAINCAQKCLDFDYPKEKYEVLIGDDSSDASVSGELALFAEKHENVRVIKREKNDGYKAGNLNNMLAHSKGEFVVLFDSDFLPEADFLKRIIAPMLHDRGIAAVQARWKFANADQNLVSLLGATIVAIVHRVALPFFNKRRRLSILCGSAEAVRKDVLVKLGGWRHGSLTEDIEYSLRLLKEGHRIQYLPELECASEVPYTPKDLYRQQMRWAYGVISSLKEHFKIFLSRKLNLEDKLLVVYVFSGYIFTITMFAVFLFGALEIITHEPEAINFAKFFLETGKNFLWTSGLLVTGIYSLKKAGSNRKIRQIALATARYGIITTYYVNIGILKVLTGKPMPWFLLSKKGNEASK